MAYHLRHPTILRESRTKRWNQHLHGTSVKLGSVTFRPALMQISRGYPRIGPDTFSLKPLSKNNLRPEAPSSRGTPMMVTHLHTFCTSRHKVYTNPATRLSNLCPHEVLRTLTASLSARPKLVNTLVEGLHFGLFGRAQAKPITKYSGHLR